ncbi:MAG: hypothetical protein ACPGUV_06545 [Polyangiales bacterium]
MVVVVALGCRVNHQDIETWKGTVKGPGKIVAVLEAERYPLPLRAQAAMALVEMEHPEVEGVPELLKSMGRLDTATRHAVLKQMLPELFELMKEEVEAEEGEGADSKKGVDTPPPPSTAAVRAKDTAYHLIAHAAQAEREQLIDAVVAWFARDFNGRSRSGDVSSEQVMKSVGERAAVQLVEALDAKMPPAALVKLAELIGQQGGDKSKAEAAARLVAIEKEMRSAAFLQWIEQRLRGQVAGQKVDEKRLKQGAELNRAVYIDEGLIASMKHLADQEVVRVRLMAMATQKSSSDTEAERRKKALQALEGNVGEAQLKALTALALSAGAPPGVRDYAFDRIGDIRSRKTLPALWPLLQGGAQGRVRARVGELILAIGGRSVVAEFFQRLPSPEGGYPPQELEGYAQRLSQMSPPPSTLVRGQLASEAWWKQVIALRFLERRGERADVQRMQALVASTTMLQGKGWPKDKTLGAVAKESIQALKERLEQPGSQPSRGD